MADITKCDGLKIAELTYTVCPKRDECYRHTANDGLRQAYFTNAPLDGGQCLEFIPALGKTAKSEE